VKFAKVVAPAVLLLAGATAVADSWIAPEAVTAVSPDGRHLVRAQPVQCPADADEYSSCGEAIGYRLGEGDKYRIAWRVSLGEGMCSHPVHLVVSDSGDWLAIDCWASVGRSRPVLLSGADGKPRKSWTLAQLVPAEVRCGFMDSVSSTWWFDDASADYGKFVIRDSAGGRITLDPANAELEYTRPDTLPNAEACRSSDKP
jgi:hypothetical protein